MKLYTLSLNLLSATALLGLTLVANAGTPAASSAPKMGTPKMAVKPTTTKMGKMAHAKSVSYKSHTKSHTSAKTKMSAKPKAGAKMSKMSPKTTVKG